MGWHWRAGSLEGQGRVKCVDKDILDTEVITGLLGYIPSAFLCLFGVTCYVTELNDQWPQKQYSIRDQCYFWYYLYTIHNQFKKKVFEQ